MIFEYMDRMVMFQDTPEGLTADECAAIIGQTVLATRPRVTELNKQGKIIRTGQRRKNVSGASAIVWKATL